MLTKVVGLAALMACHTDQGAPKSSATFTTAKGPVTVQLEVAATEAARARGLMFRDKLAADAGMLFVFERSEPLGFWMKNTYIPLDMVFIDDAWRVVGVVARAEPMTLQSRGVAAPARYVLELNGGFCETHGIGVGTSLKVSGIRLAP